MSTTDAASQPFFDPHYEWQGEHYEWQGREVHSIQENINPGSQSAALRPHVMPEPPSAPDPLGTLSKLYAVMAVATPAVLLGGFFISPYFFLAFLPLFPLCGLGGLILPLVGLANQSGRLFMSGVFGLCVFLGTGYGLWQVLSTLKMPC